MKKCSTYLRIETITKLNYRLNIKFTQTFPKGTLFPIYTIKTMRSKLGEDFMMAALIDYKNYQITI